MKNVEVEEKSVIEEIVEETKEKKIDVKVSVIIPVYNVEKYLKQCLDSVITQTYTNLEIICVDDGSTDHSLDILRFYEKKDSRIKVLTQKNQGPSVARNRALDVATGKYISFVDSDDYLQWNAYEILTLVAEQNDLDLIMFGANVFPYEQGEPWIKEKLSTSYKVYEQTKPSDVIFHEKASVPFLWLHFVKRNLFERPWKIRFDETMNLAEDQLLQFQYVPRAKKVMVIDDKLYNYRVVRQASIMQLYSARKIQKVEMHMTLIQKVIEAWKAEGYYETEVDNLATWMTNFIFYSIVNLPMEFKKKYSLQFLKIMEENSVCEYLIADYELRNYETMKEWANWSGSSKEELANLKESIECEKYEILETLKSRAFHMGRKLTKKSKRLDLTKFDQIEL
ncbi:MAG: glycosyltransferase [Lachnospiraceae bacterium]|nr:glycosyltransferase [Lachnospiraceae bacterium]